MCKQRDSLALARLSLLPHKWMHLCWNGEVSDHFEGLGFMGCQGQNLVLCALESPGLAKPPWQTNIYTL